MKQTCEGFKQIQLISLQKETKSQTKQKIEHEVCLENNTNSIWRSFLVFYHQCWTWFLCPKYIKSAHYNDDHAPECGIKCGFSLLSDTIVYTNLLKMSLKLEQPKSHLNHVRFIHINPSVQRSIQKPINRCDSFNNTKKDCKSVQISLHSLYSSPIRLVEPIYHSSSTDDKYNLYTLYGQNIIVCPLRNARQLFFCQSYQILCNY